MFGKLFGPKEEGIFLDILNNDLQKISANWKNSTLKEISKKRVNPLEFAIYEGKKEIIKFFFNKLQNDDICTYTPLDICTSPKLSLDEKKELIEICEQKGIEIILSKEIQAKKVKHKFNTLSYIGNYYEGDDRYELVRFLLKKFVPVECFGESALYDAIWFGNTKLIEIFSDIGINADFITSQGEGAFSKMGKARLDRAPMKFTECFEIMKLVYENASPFTKNDLMLKPYIFRYDDTFDYGFMTCYAFFVSFYESGLEKEVTRFFYDNNFDFNEIHDDQNQTTHSLFLTLGERNDPKLIREIFEKFPSIMVRGDFTNVFFYLLVEDKKVSKETIRAFIEKVEYINYAYERKKETTTLIDQFLNIYQVYDEEHVNMLLDIEDINPEMKITWDCDDNEHPFFIAFLRMFSLETLARILDKTKDINRLMTRTIYSNFHAMDINLLTYIISFSKKKFYFPDERAISPYEAYQYKKGVIKLLCERGADVDHLVKLKPEEKSPYGTGVRIETRSVLEFACIQDAKFGETTFTKILLEHNADITQKIDLFEYRIEHLLVMSPDISEEMAIKLLTLIKEYRPNEIDLNALNTYNANTVLMAAEHCKAKCIEWLIKNGADPFLVGGHDNTVATNRAIGVWSYYNIEKRLATIKVLLDAGLDINATGPDKRTALHEAVHEGFVEIVEFLLNQGADINAQTERGNTVLHEAAKNLYLAKLFLNKGIDINAKNQNGRTALYEAIKNNSVEIVKLLLDKGTTGINEGGRNGITPLLLAAEFASLEIVKLLHNCGADINAKAVYGQSAVHLACVAISDAEYRCGISDNEDKTSKEAMANVINERMQIIKYLVEQGVEVGNCASYENESFKEILEKYDAKEVSNIIRKNIFAIDIIKSDQILARAVYRGGNDNFDDKIRTIKNMRDKMGSINADTCNSPELAAIRLLETTDACLVEDEKEEAMKEFGVSFATKEIGYGENKKAFDYNKAIVRTQKNINRNEEVIWQKITLDLDSKRIALNIENTFIEDAWESADFINYFAQGNLLNEKICDIEISVENLPKLLPVYDVNLKDISIEEFELLKNQLETSHYFMLKNDLSKVYVY